MSKKTSIARRYVRLSAAHPFLLLMAFTVLTAIGAWGAILVFGNIQTDFANLLPDDSPSRQAWEQARERRGSTDLYIIAVESPDAYANVDFILALRDRIEADGEAQGGQGDQDPSVLRAHALLYLPTPRLEEFRDDLRRALRCELQQINAAFVEVGDACAEVGEVEWSVDAWLGPDLMRELGLPQEFFGEWSNRGTAAAATDTDQDESEGEVATPNAAPAGIPAELDHYIIAEDGDNFVSVLYVQLDKPSTDAEYANEMEALGSALIADLGPENYHPDMQSQVVGPYQSLNEAREAASDSMYALFASLIIVVFIMIAFFRAFRGLIVVLVPLVMGLAWTMGLAWVIYGELNLYTMFVGSVLLGMGIDFGIHVYGRAMEAFQRGKDWNDSLVESLEHTGGALIASAITTVGALLTLLASHFKGFREFGVIASLGVVLCMLAAYFVIPPLVLALERIWALKKRTKAGEQAAKAFVSRRIWIAAGLAVFASTLIAGSMAPDAEFEYDFRNLRGPKSTASIKYGRAVGRSRGGSPSFILAENAEQIHQAHELLRHRFAVENDPFLKGFVTIETYRPPGSEQCDRLALANRGLRRSMGPETCDALEEDPVDPDDPFARPRDNDIASEVNRAALDRLDGEAREFVDAIREMVNAEPFEMDDIPHWAYRSLTESDGSVGNLGMMFKRLNEWNIREVQAYHERYATLELPAGTVRIADPTFISGDIVALVQEDGKRMAGFVSVILVLVLLVALRNLAGTILCLLTLGAGFTLAVGMMVVTGTRVGMYNMIVLPAVLGVSIDGAIHIYHRFREAGPGQISHVMRTTGIAVAAASLTTAGGFAGLIFQDHMGIRSIGELALIGIVSSLVAVFLLMPGLLLLVSGKPKTAPD